MVTYPLRVDGTEQYLEVRERLLRDGYRRVFTAGEVLDLDEVQPSRALSGGRVEVVLDRLVVGREKKRLIQSIELGWQRSPDSVTVHAEERALVLRRGLSCPECARELEAARPGLLSYDSPLGACATCRGFGRTLGVDLTKVIPDPTRSIAKGAVRPWRGESTKWERAELNQTLQTSRHPHGCALGQALEGATARHHRG